MKIISDSITLIHARPNDKLAARLSLLYLDPENGEHFNDIEHFERDQLHYTKRKDVPTNKPVGSEVLMQSAEEEEGETRSMVSSIISFMNSMMSRFMR